jgi:uncharacterized protein (TIGR02453 family)
MAKARVVAPQPSLDDVVAPRRSAELGADPTGPAGHIGPELFAFLRELREHNDRAWFAANRERYEAHVREPLLRFVADFGPHLREISPSFVADPRPVGGSLFRIQRDTRFSMDKSPYKTNAGAQFRHEAGRDAHAPGFYLHLEPGEVFAAAGLWRPGRTELGRVREAIVSDPAEWGRVVTAPAFGSVLSLGGEQLERPPRGYDPDHPFIEDLKRKDLIVTAAFAEAEACRPEFLDRFVRTCQAAAPFVRYLTAAIGLSW